MVENTPTFAEMQQMINRITAGLDEMQRCNYPSYLMQSIARLQQECGSVYQMIEDVATDLEDYKENGDAAFTEELEEHTITNPNQVRFIRDMIANGHEERLQYYHGRYFYEGAAVLTDYDNGISEEDIVRDTSVSLQRDNMGRDDMILYPRWV